MELTFEKRREKLKTLPEEIQNLYWMPESGEILYKTYKKYNLPEEKYKNFGIAVGDVILGFYKKSDLPKVLMAELSVTEDVANTMSLDLKDFLSKIEGEFNIANTKPQNIPQANNQLKEKLELRPEGVQRPMAPPPPTPPTAPSEPTQGAMKPLTRDEVLKALSPKRTMKSDIEAMRVDDGK